MSVVNETIAQLLCVYLELDNDKDFSRANGVYNFRDLYKLPLHSYADKCALLRAAEASGCSAVILDVLLFVSATMAPLLFRKQLAKLPLSLNQWVYYLVEQCILTNETVSLNALQGLLDLYATTQRYRELAAMLLSMVFNDRDFSQSLRVIDDVLGIIKLYRHRFPKWILDLLHEYMTLSKLLEDINTAPKCCKILGCILLLL
ncbi:unnamed protein product [Peronospora destructor]|uniref:Uncharacterized protein n=1 Tax=Peronospora destructor TaxID=86335 RepID=A0AAV0TCJ1_9STRA|nr:unnamed protein product [Peronospora destructor]